MSARRREIVGYPSMTATLRPTLSALIVVASMSLPGCGSRLGGVEANAQTTTTASQDLSVVPAGAGNSFRLLLAPCDSDGCALMIGWASGTELLASDALDWGAASEQEAQVQEDYWVGGLMSAPGANGDDDGLAAYTVGEQYSAVTTRLEPIAVGGGAAALLVRQMAGYEHIKRRFYLYVANGDRLTRIWEGVEGTGPYQSDVAVSQGADGLDEIIYVKGFAPGSDDSPDEISYTRLQWLADQAAVDQETIVGLPIVVIDPGLTSVAAARAMLSNDAACLGGHYWVLPGSRIDGTNVDEFAVVSPAIDDPAASREVTRLQTCNPKLEARIARLREPN